MAEIIDLAQARAARRLASQHHNDFFPGYSQGVAYATFDLGFAAPVLAWSLFWRLGYAALCAWQGPSQPRLSGGGQRQIFGNGSPST
jgi:hypothetical protein